MKHDEGGGACHITQISCSRMYNQLVAVLFSITAFCLRLYLSVFSFPHPLVSYNQ